MYTSTRNKFLLNYTLQKKILQYSLIQQGTINYDNQFSVYGISISLDDVSTQVNKLGALSLFCFSHIHFLLNAKEKGSVLSQSRSASSFFLLQLFILHWSIIIRLSSPGGGLGILFVISFDPDIRRSKSNTNVNIR